MLIFAIAGERTSSTVRILAGMGAVLNALAQVSLAVKDFASRTLTAGGRRMDDLRYPHVESGSSGLVQYGDKGGKFCHRLEFTRVVAETYT